MRAPFSTPPLQAFQLALPTATLLVVQVQQVTAAAVVLLVVMVLLLQPKAAAAPLFQQEQQQEQEQEQELGLGLVLENRGVATVCLHSSLLAMSPASTARMRTWYCAAQTSLTPKSLHLSRPPFTQATASLCVNWLRKCTFVA